VFDEETCEYILEVEDPESERVDDEGAQGASHAIRPWYLGDGDQTHTHRCHSRDPPDAPQVERTCLLLKKTHDTLHLPTPHTFSLSLLQSLQNLLFSFESLNLISPSKNQFEVSRLRVRDLEGGLRWCRRQELPRDYRHPLLLPSVMNLNFLGACPRCKQSRV